MCTFYHLLSFQPSFLAERFGHIDAFGYFCTQYMNIRLRHLADWNANRAGWQMRALKNVDRFGLLATTIKNAKMTTSCRSCILQEA